MGMEYSGSELVDIAKQIEAAGEAFYATALERVEEPEIRRVFSFLRAEEARHATVFEDLLSQVEEADGDWRLDEEYMGYMRALADERVFPSLGKAADAVAKLKSETDALKYALSFEKDTILFLHELRPTVRSESHGILDKLIAEERTHVRMLYGLLAMIDNDAANKE